MTIDSKILSIVIPVFNKYNFTKACLQDLSKLPSNHEIIIFDNGSTDETKSKLDKSTEIKYIRNEINLGFAKACNLGYYYSTAPSVLFLNNDIRVKSDHSSWTQALIDKCNEGIVGPTMGQLDYQFNFVKEANTKLTGNSYMSGWCLASSKDIWNKLDMPRNNGMIVMDSYVPQIFSEEFGLAYFEDTDLGFRARKLGINMQVVDVPVVHFGKQTSSQLNTHNLYTKAKKIFIKKWIKNI